MRFGTNHGLSESPCVDRSYVASIVEQNMQILPTKAFETSTLDFLEILM